jgi:hypothetical protein
MPTYATNRAFTASTWQRFNLAHLPVGMADVTVYAKTNGCGVAISDAQPTHGIAATDPIFYIDSNVISQFRADPCKLWLYATGTNNYSILVST